MGKHWNLSEETKRKMSELHQGKNNRMWKDKPKSRAIHKWVRRHFWPTRLCQMCLEKSPRDLANITGVYNRDFKNWRYYCRKCHMESDGRMVQALTGRKRDPKTGRFVNA